MYFVVFRLKLGIIAFGHIYSYNRFILNHI